MTIVVAYAPRPEGQAALDKGIEIARRRNEHLLVINATPGNADNESMASAHEVERIEALLKGPETTPACGLPLRTCGAFCVDVASDAANCGGCGRVCPADQVCAAGACRVNCEAGQAAWRERRGEPAPMTRCPSPCRQASPPTSPRQITMIGARIGVCL